VTTHAAGCTMPTPMTDPSGHLRCPACKYVQPKPRGGGASSNYRCREHIDQPVNWRGKGCTRCAADLKPRKATQPSDDYEMEYR
jgi:hypothetical protein